MCFPKIDDSPPQGEWACLKMHEVMRPSFLLPLSLSLSPSLFLSSFLTAAATSGKRLPNNPRRSEATSKSHSLLPSQLLSGWLSVTYDDQLADSVINDAAEDPRLINRQKKLAVVDMIMHPMDTGEDGWSLALSVVEGVEKQV